MPWKRPRRPQRAVALPRDTAQGTLELGELPFEAPAVVAGDTELVVAVIAIEPLAVVAESDADMQFGGGEADGERDQEHHGGEDADDDREFGEN